MKKTELSVVKDILEINPPQREQAFAERASELATAQPATPRRYPCRHIFIDGRQCGSPALRDQNFCYYHQTHRAATRVKRRSRKTERGFDLLCMDGLENPTSIQLGIAQVLGQIAEEQISHKSAWLLLYGLQIASRNISQLRSAGNAAEAITEDDVHGALAVAEPGRNVPESLNTRILKALADPNRTGLEELVRQSEAEWEAEAKKSGYSYDE